MSNIDLENADREVGLEPLPYWQRRIAKSCHEQNLCVAGHVKPRHIQALIQSSCPILSDMTAGQFEREIRKAVGTANVTQPVMLDMIANSWGL